MKVAIGEDSHKFNFESKTEKPLILAGVVFEKEPCLLANSDGDVVLHAITNAISGITGVNILGAVSDSMCQSGIIDSKEYLKKALTYLEGTITHISISMECKFPKISPRIEEMRKSIASLLNISERSVGITATSGEELTEFGKGNGIHVFCCVTVE